jgi:hypothetical protein
MKWYSVKTHVPTDDAHCFVHRRGIGIDVASFDGEKYNSEADFMVTLNDVTHFCIPDPVTIED